MSNRLRRSTRLALSLTLLASSALGQVVPTAAPAVAPTAPTGPTAAPAPEPPSAVTGNELIVNAFRNPSIGLEFRHRFVSFHAGAYTTVINEGDTGFGAGSWFFRAGVSVWFLPVPLLGTRRSSFYADVSFVHELSGDGWGSGVAAEAGFRLVIWQGIFLRLGATVLAAPGRRCPAALPECDRVRVTPATALGWGFAW